jgi:glycosyltransferase involved in cell wall biosynthesis
MPKNDSAPRISVIIPTYNRADFIGETIQSVLDQTYADFELIVLDDASTDDTAQVVARFGDERLTYIYQENNVGETAARNAGFAYARGELVSFLDSDDRMLPHNLETLVALLDVRPEVSVAYGWYYWMDKDGQPIMEEYPKIEEQIPPQIDSPWPDITLRPSGLTPEGQILPQLVLVDLMMIGSTLIRRECVEAIGGFGETVQFQGHWDFYLRLARAGYTYACSKQAVAVWRIHPGNRGGYTDVMLASRLAILDRLFDDPALETTLKGVRQQAYYKAYMDYALVHYNPDHLEQGVRYLNKALQYAPLRSEDLAKLSEKMVNYALAPEVKDPLRFARDLFKSIRSTPEVRRLRNKVLGQVNAALAFRHYQAEELNQVWRHALGAVSHDLSWLRNRGLARIALEGLVGRGIVKRIKATRV